MVNKESKVIIVTRTKNRPLLLKRALKSVQSQSFLNYLHVIVNDGGDPKVVESLCQDCGNSRIRIVHHSSSLGMEAASNAGLKSYKGKYAVIHDDDDSWHPNFLEVMVSRLDFLPHTSGVVCNINQIFETLSDDGIYRLSSRLFNPAVKNFIYDDFLVVNQFVPIAFLYKYDVHSEVGWYDESLSVCGDWDFYLRFLKSYSISKVEEPLANYHLRQNGSGDSINSVSKLDLHKKATSLILSRYDFRSKGHKLLSLLRVKIIYRAINFLLRKLALYGFKGAQ